MAGARKRAYIDTIVSALTAHDIHASIYETRSAGDAITALPKLTPDFDVVVAAGGDGTVNEVINGIRGSSVRLGIIPCGTTNVLGIELGLPKKPAAIAAMLAAQHTQDVYLGEVNGRRFGMMVGVGYDARVVEGVPAALKQKIGKLAYVLAMVRELKHFGRQQYQLHIDDSVHTAAAVVCTLGRHYAGSYLLVKNANVSEPVMDVVLVQTLNRWAFLLMLLALPLGLAARLPFMKIVQGQRVTITPYPAPAADAAAENLQADGDTVGVLPAHLSMVQPALKVLVPRHA